MPAGGIAEIGLVERIEMKLVEAAGAQLLHLVGQHRGGDDAAAFHIFVQPVIGARQPGRESRHRPWPPCAPRRVKLVVGMMPGMMGMAMPARAASSRKRAVGVIVEAELAQRPAGAGLHLALQKFDVMAMTGRIRMAFGIKGDADLERRDAADACDQFRRGSIAFGMGAIGPVHVRHVAAQRHDMADAGIPIAAHDLVDLGRGTRHAGQMRGGLQRSSPRQCA